MRPDEKKNTAKFKKTLLTKPKTLKTEMAGKTPLFTARARFDVSRRRHTHTHTRTCDPTGLESPRRSPNCLFKSAKFRASTVKIASGAFWGYVRVREACGRRERRARLVRRAPRSPRPRGAPPAPAHRAPLPRAPLPRRRLRGNFLHNMAALHGDASKNVFRVIFFLILK